MNRLSPFKLLGSLVNLAPDNFAFLDCEFNSEYDMTLPTIDVCVYQVQGSPVHVDVGSIPGQVIHKPDKFVFQRFVF
jgi:hypothetical protein